MEYNIDMVFKALYIAFISIFLAATAYSGTSRITASELKSMLEKNEPVTIIDVRSLEEFNEGHIPGAVPVGSAGDLKSLRYEGRVVLYCNTGRRSEQALKLFAENGIPAVDLEGGIKAWESVGGNIVAGPYRDISEYPKTFEIPKGVCEPLEPAIEIVE